MKKMIAVIFLCVFQVTKPAIAQQESASSPSPKQLQGTVEQNDTAGNRIVRPLAGQAPQTDMPPLAPSLKGKANETNLSGVVDSTNFALSPLTPIPIGYIQPGTHQPPFLVTPEQPHSDQCNKQAIIGNTSGGQDEWWVDWNPWLHRVGIMITNALVSVGTYSVWGGTTMEFTVTKDHRVHIDRIYNGDKVGLTETRLRQAMQLLQNNIMLEFPSGTSKSEMQCKYWFDGLPRWAGIGGLYVYPFGIEHHVKQW